MVKSNYAKVDMDAEVTAMQSWNAGATSTSFNALYADLNSPAVVKRPDPADPIKVITTPIFPIADPAAIGAVEGFSANVTVAGTTLSGSGTDRRLPMPAKWIYVLKDGQLTSPSSGDSKTVTFTGTPVPSQNNPIVGRIAFWADDDTCKLNINTASEGTFWDTPKANTILEQRLAIAAPVSGEFSRMSGHPSMTSLSAAFGSLMPVSPPYFLNSFSTFNTGVADNRDDQYQETLNYFNLTPRINGALSDNGSRRGLRQTTAIENTSYLLDSSRPEYLGKTPSGGVNPNPVWRISDLVAGPAQGAPLVPDTQRLYATADEVLFAEDRSMNILAPDPASASQNIASKIPSLASEVARRNFFLTANSRSPETTLLGTPRVALWPINSETGNQTVKDRLIRNCSQINGQPYYFDRFVGAGYNSGQQGATDPTGDVSRTRNAQLLTYLRNLTSAATPGEGTSFATKWGSGVNNILAQTFDIIRTTNIDYVDYGNSTGGYVTYRYGAYPSNPSGVISRTDANRLEYLGSPRGYVVPAEISAAAKGAGRFTTIGSAAIVIMATEVENTLASGNITCNGTFYQDSTGSGTISYSGTLTDGIEISNGVYVTYKVDPSRPTSKFTPPLPGGTTQLVWRGGQSPAPVVSVPSIISQKTNKIRAFLAFQPYNPTPGGAGFASGGQLTVSGFQSLSLNGTPFGGGDGTSRFGTMSNPRYWADDTRSLNNPISFMLFPGILVAATDSRDSAFAKWPRGNWPEWGASNPNGWTANMDTVYPFVSDEIDVSGATSLGFSGGTINVTLGTWTNNTAVQTFSIQFDQASGMPVPQHMTLSGQNFANGQPATPPNSTWWRDGRLGEATSPSRAGDSLYLPKRFRMNYDNIAANYFVSTGDIVLGVQPTRQDPVRGDLRLIALTKNVGTSYFEKIPGYGTVSSPFLGSSPLRATDATGRYAHSFRNETKNIARYGTVAMYVGTQSTSGSRTVGLMSLSGLGQGAKLVSGVTFANDAVPVASVALTEANLSSNTLGDAGGATGPFKDGAILPRVESVFANASFGGFFDRAGVGNPDGSMFEPNRMVPSAGLLGSMVTPDSTGTLQGWRSLLFTSAPAGGSGHPGFNQPADHFYLDNFWMPIIEPYAISDQLSTAGKVNLNSQVLPFTHITRTTALRGALKPLMLSAVPDTAAGLANANYKSGSYQEPMVANIRYPLNLDETVTGHLEKFNATTDFPFYRSATEVSTIRLVPDDPTASPAPTASNIASWWSSRQVTSDTLREQPYTALLSRVTTKSNTFTVHYRVQALRQSPGAGRNWAEWVEGQDQIVGEFRGATTIERFLDPNAPNIPDYAQVNLSGTYDPIDKWYRWRVLSQNQFAP